MTFVKILASAALTSGGMIGRNAAARAKIKQPVMLAARTMPQRRSILTSHATCLRAITGSTAVNTFSVNSC
jgi:hypothetical protein